MSKGILSATMLGCLVVGTISACQRRERAPVREEPRGVPPSPTNSLPPAPKGDEDTDAANTLATLHQDNENEIDLGKLAEKRGRSRMARQFGAMLVKDHKAADGKIMAFVNENHVVLDAGDAQKKMEAKAKEKREALEKLYKTGPADFDKEFGRLMTKGHEEAIELVKSAQKDLKDPKLQALLAELQPTLEKHLEHARMLESGTVASEGATKRAQGRRTR
jgi:putative membrane protein